ncbi:MAG TPA: hypothetical protein DD618_01645 [Acholeplasmatales bacterium]|nr:hypothetical protein [Acholeplasmatales bacterium]
MIAVDAGGTKTKLCAFTKNKEMVYELVGGSGVPVAIKGEAHFPFYELVQKAVSDLKNRFEITYVQLGISGLGIVPNVKSREEELSALLGYPVSMENDALIGLYSLKGIPTGEQILVLSGTGSSVLGYRNGQRLLVGGYGHLLTEKGSGFSAVKTLITGIIESFEQDGPLTELEKKFLNLIGAKSAYDLKPFVYLRTKSQIADYGRFIGAEAASGDVQAISILKQSGKDLAGFVEKVYRKMHLTDPVTLGFRGSFVQKAPYVKEEVIKCLHEDGYDPIIAEGEHDPIYGAYYLALEKGKI